MWRQQSTPAAEALLLHSCSSLNLPGCGTSTPFQAMMRLVAMSAIRQVFIHGCHRQLSCALSWSQREICRALGKPSNQAKTTLLCNNHVVHVDSASSVLSRLKARPQGTALNAKSQRRKGVTAAASLHSKQLHQYRIVNSPTVNPSAAVAAAEQRLRLLSSSKQHGHKIDANPTTPLHGKLPMSSEDAIEDMEDGDLEPSAMQQPRCHALQTRDLDVEEVERFATPQPHQACPDTGNATVIGSRSAMPAPQLASERTPAAGHGSTNGTSAQRALLARLAATPKAASERLHAQPRPQVHMRSRLMLAICWLLLSF